MFAFNPGYGAQHQHIYFLGALINDEIATIYEYPGLKIRFNRKSVEQLYKKNYPTDTSDDISNSNFIAHNRG